MYLQLISDQEEMKVSPVEDNIKLAREIDLTNRKTEYQEGNIVTYKTVTGKLIVQDLEDERMKCLMVEALGIDPH